MAKLQDLEKLLVRQQEGSPDAVEESREWTSALHDFMSDIKSWLAEPARKGLLILQDDVMQMDDEGFGDYDAPALLITTARRRIWIRPIMRRMPIGEGRVDMWSSVAAATFVRIPANGQRQWRHALDGIDDVSQWPALTQDVFFELLETLLQQ